MRPNPLFVVPSVVVALALHLAVAPGNAFAGEPGAASGLREMRTDRPDATESPFTVDAGHVQLEMDFANYLRDRQQGTRTVEWEVAPLNLRFGVTPNFEAGIFLSPFRRVSATPRGAARTTQSGFGDVTVRTKWNLRGNDGGALGVGVMADVTLPTATNGLGIDKPEAALSFPVAFELAGGWSGGAMTVVQAGYGDDDDYRAVWLNTLTFGRDITETLGGFVEVTSATGDGAHVATFNCGLTRRFGPNVQFDCGVNLGVSRTAPDLLIFTGLSRRF